MKYKVQRYKVQLVKDGRAALLATKRIPCADDAEKLFYPVFAGLPHEEVWMALCDAKNEVLGLVRVGQGGMHGCALKPSDVLRPAIAAGASGYILAHNHPSNDPTPSQADIEMTRLLIKASGIVGVTCLDHLILTWTGGYRSLRDSLVFDD